MKKVGELKNMTTNELSIELKLTLYQIFKMVFSLFIAILISYKLSSIISSIEIFDNSPILFWFVILFIFTAIWIISLILINYIQTSLKKSNKRRKY